MDLLTLLIVILLVAWLVGGFVVPVGGSLVHILLVVVLAIVLIKVLRLEPL